MCVCWCVAGSMSVWYVLGDCSLLETLRMNLNLNGMEFEWNGILLFVRFFVVVSHCVIYRIYIYIYTVYHTTTDDDDDEKKNEKRVFHSIQIPFRSNSNSFVTFPTTNNHPTHTIQTYFPPHTSTHTYIPITILYK
mmetsp:Transcript_22335/g.25130  ORF Transcript_22335/g.25130 Transcript_22335/m.25130 type:complete len:136 (-) Transcript_22335:31-438(-)